MVDKRTFVTENLKKNTVTSSTKTTGSTSTTAVPSKINTSSNSTKKQECSTKGRTSNDKTLHDPDNSSSDGNEEASVSPMPSSRQSSSCSPNTNTIHTEADISYSSSGRPVRKSVALLLVVIVQ